MQHTPAPWKYNVHNGGHYFADIEAALGMKDGINQIRTVGLVLKYAPENEREANARLIAAAPDMLAALKLAFKIPRPWIMGGRTIAEEEWGAAVDAVSSAIAKAEGSKLEK